MSKGRIELGSASSTSPFLKMLLVIMCAMACACGAIVLTLGDNAFAVDEEMEVQADSSGVCGPNATWNYNSSTHTLTVSGTGEMTKALGRRITDTVIIEEGITSLPDGAFKGSFTIQSIQLPSTLERIGANAFSGCYGFTSIAIPASVVSIQDGAFSGCSKLQSVLFKEESKLESIGDRAFASCKALNSAELPSTVTMLGEGAFYECNALEMLSLKCQITELKKNTFYGCDALITAFLPSTLKTIDEEAFFDSGIQRIAIPDGVTVIGERAFRSCGKLKDVTFGSSLESIGAEAFGSCGVKSIVLPLSLETIGEDAFRSCASLESIEIAACKTMGPGMLKYCDSLKSVTLGPDVRMLGEDFLASNANVNHLELPEGLQIIGKAAFAKSSISGSVRIPSTVKEIDDNAFGNCSISEVEFLGPAPKIGSDAFWNVTASAIYPADEGTWTHDMQVDYMGKLTWYARNKSGELVKDPYWNRFAKHIDLPVGEWSINTFSSSDNITTTSYDFRLDKDEEVTLKFYWDYGGCTHASFMFSIKDSNGEQQGPHGRPDLDKLVGNPTEDVRTDVTAYSPSFDDTQGVSYTFSLVKGEYHIELVYFNSHKGGSSTFIATSVSVPGNDSGKITGDEPHDPGDESGAIVGWKRLAGDNAFKTMQQIFNEGSFKKGGTVVLASINGYWDALTAAGIAGLYNAPVIMVDELWPSDEGKEILNQLEPRRIIVCGGEATIDDLCVRIAMIYACTYEETMARDPDSDDINYGGEVIRCAGNTATGTAVDIYKKGKGWSDTAIIATVGTYHDALAAAPLAYANKMPIFLAEWDGTLSKETLTAMKAGGIKKAYIAGGNYWIKDSAKTQLSSNGIALVKRLAGATAVETSSEIAKEAISAFGMTANGLGLATTATYHDALAGAALCGQNKSVLLLAANEKSSSITQFVAGRAKDIDGGYVFGGTGSVSPATMSALEKAAG